MATIEVSNSGTRRALDHTIPLMPFIDFMLCLVAFLLVTAAWSQMARLKALADGTGGEGTPHKSEAQLHITVRDNLFELAWRDGSTVLSTSEAPRKVSAADPPRYPELANALASEWSQHGVHRSPSDPASDRVVLHTPNSLPFADVVAVMDAIGATKRSGTAATSDAPPAFAVSFAVN